MHLQSPTTDQVPLQFLIPSTRYLFCPYKQKALGHKRWANRRLRLWIFLPFFPFFCHGNADRPVIGRRCGCVTAHLHKAEPVTVAQLPSVRWEWMAAGHRRGFRRQCNTRWILLKHFYLHIFPCERQERETKESLQLQCGYYSQWSDPSIKCQLKNKWEFGILRNNSVQMEIKRNKSYLRIVCRSLVWILLLLKRRQGPCQHLSPFWR